MYNHPYGSWSPVVHSSSGHANRQDSATPPSTYGALPYPPSSPLIAYYLTSFNPTILNCVVVGPDARALYRVSTDSITPGYTVMDDFHGGDVALIEWQSPPFVEIRDMVPKKDARSWLNLRHDLSARYMEVKGMLYTWAPAGEYLHLCTASPSSHFLGRVSRGRKNVSIELTNSALQLGLLEVAVVATLLLQCGRNID